jgi:hypothetical protein
MPPKTSNAAVSPHAHQFTGVAAAATLVWYACHA